MSREEGTVKWFDDHKGYGFITRDCGGEAFIHFSDIRMQGRKTLEKGDRVEFSISEQPKGRQAVEVVRLVSITEAINVNR